MDYEDEDIGYTAELTTKNIKGRLYPVMDDEVILDDDPDGDKKIDKDGNLLGGEPAPTACEASSEHAYQAASTHFPHSSCPRGTTQTSGTPSPSTLHTPQGHATRSTCFARTPCSSRPTAPATKRSSSSSRARCTRT
jgi:hypothetical protein